MAVVATLFSCPARLRCRVLGGVIWKRGLGDVPNLRAIPIHPAEHAREDRTFRCDNTERTRMNLSIWAIASALLSLMAGLVGYPRLLSRPVARVAKTASVLLLAAFVALVVFVVIQHLGDAG